MYYYQQPYQQPYQQGPIDPGKSFQIASFVCGIAGIVLCWFWYLGLPSAVTGLVLAILGKKKSAMYGFRPTGFGTAGFICSIVGSALSGIFALIGIGSLLFWGNRYSYYNSWSRYFW
jgi:hypothetical protein